MIFRYLLLSTINEKLQCRQQQNMSTFQWLRHQSQLQSAESVLVVAVDDEYSQDVVSLIKLPSSVKTPSY